MVATIAMTATTRLTRTIACASTLVVLLAFPSTASAQLTAEEIACRSKISKGFAKVVKAKTKAIAGCHKRRNKGDVPEAVGCNEPAVADSQTGLKAAGTVLKWSASVNAACTGVTTVASRFPTCPAPFETSDDGGATTDIDSYDEAIACLYAHADSILAEAATTALGEPDSPLSPEVSKCHGAIAKGLAKTIDTVVKVRNLCQTLADKGGGTLEFDCYTTDNDAKIALAAAKAGDLIEKSCVTDVALADSCGTTAAAIETCAIGEAATGAADAISALGWESKRTCPGAVTMAVHPGLFDLDVGWNGVLHDQETVTEGDLLRFPITCAADCTGCTGTPAVVGDHCRCVGDSSQSCSTNGDCAAFGAECRCYWGPPLPISGIGGPFCATSTITSLSAGTAVPATGDAAVNASLAIRIFVGGQPERACATCEGGACVGGPRDGLACSVDSAHVLGDTSLDCMPAPANGVTGSGLPFTLALDTGSYSMPFNVPCDAPNGGEMCACSTCSLNNAIPCNDDATCASASAGVCRTDGGHGGEPRRQNACDFDDCSASLEDATEGACGGGPIDAYCDGLVRENGLGVLWCGSNVDCGDPVCPGNPGGDCGTCTHYNLRECFLDPITATGAPGETLVGGGCTMATHPLIHEGYGLPGPFRFRQSFSLHSVMCPDGVTPFQGPGGSNCP